MNPKQNKPKESMPRHIVLKLLKTEDEVLKAPGSEAKGGGWNAFPGEKHQFECISHVKP